MTFAINKKSSHITCKLSASISCSVNKASASAAQYMVSVIISRRSCLRAAAADQRQYEKYSRYNGQQSACCLEHWRVRVCPLASHSHACYQQQTYTQTQTRNTSLYKERWDVNDYSWFLCGSHCHILQFKIKQFAPGNKKNLQKFWLWGKQSPALSLGGKGWWSRIGLAWRWRFANVKNGPRGPTFLGWRGSGLSQTIIWRWSAMLNCSSYAAPWRLVELSIEHFDPHASLPGKTTVQKPKVNHF